jgi:hypothetical protein
MLFIYYTPLFTLIIPPSLHFLKKKPVLLRIIAIFGDILYMIGGGVIAGLIIEVGILNFTILLLFNNYGTIMIISGAIIREYFKNIR